MNSNASRKKKENFPGPGTYRAPSDFGYLEMSKYKDFPTESSSNRLSPR